MTIDYTSENLISLADAAREFPGRPVSLNTLHRWRMHGVRGTKLETVLLGGIRYTSRQAIQRFIAQQNAPVETAAVVSPGQRRRQGQAALRELEAMGIGH